MTTKVLTFLTQFEHVSDLIAAKESFEAANPGVTIEIAQATDNFESMRALTSDNPPDLMDSGGWGLFQNNNMFVDLTSLVEAEQGLADDLQPGPMRIARKDGSLPALPVDVSVPLILIKKQLFDEAGISYPREGWTWAEFAELAGRLTLRNEQGVATQFGFGTAPDIEHYEPFIMRNGGSYLSPDGKTAHGYIDSEATIDAFRSVIDLYRVQGGIRKPGEPSEAGELHQRFAMVFTFTWFVGGCIQHGIVDQYELLGLPQMPAGQPGNMLYMGGVGITQASKEPELAWKFLRHYVLERPERFARSDTRTLPITRSLAEQSGMSEHPIWSRYLRELDDIRASGFYLNEKWNSSRQLINEDIKRMIVDGADVAQTLKSWTRFA